MFPRLGLSQGKWGSGSRKALGHRIYYCSELSPGRVAVVLLVLSGDWLASPTLTRQTAHTSLPRGQKNGVSQRQPRDIPSPAPPSSDPPETARREVEWETDGSTAQTMCYGQKNKNNSRIGSQALGRGF